MDVSIQTFKKFRTDLDNYIASKNMKPIEILEVEIR